MERHAERVSGAWVFRNPRVPVRALFENLEAGATVDDFWKWFPGVTREQALAVLTHAEQSLAVANQPALEPFRSHFIITNHLYIQAFSNSSKPLRGLLIH